MNYSPASSVFVKYVGRMMATRFVGFLVFFVILLQMLDLLNNSTEIYAADGAGTDSIIKYISLGAPQIASQFTPFAALLSIVFTLSALNQRSEITIMRSAGMSAQRVLFPISFVCLVIAATHFVFHEAAVVQASEELAYWEANDYAVNLPPQSATRTNIRYAQDGEFLRATSAARTDGVIQLRRVKIYDFDANGLAERVTEANFAIFKENQWLLFGARTFGVGQMQDTAPGTDLAARRDIPWDSNIDPNILFAVSLNPDRTSLGGIMRQISDLRRNSADVSLEMTSLLSRFSKPLSTLIMPLLGAIAGYGVARSGAQLLRATSGAALGFGYFVLENLLLALGKLGAIPAVIGAFFPFALFLVVGFSILLAMEN